MVAPGGAGRARSETRPRPESAARSSKANAKLQQQVDQLHQDKAKMAQAMQLLDADLKVARK